ncbi:MAG: HAMP domain-containing histidine kinase [Methanobacteriota archaeon]|nr:MAG: HAMP domain-containing histidine kinase [Euryarchaeota archaeon]
MQETSDYVGRSPDRSAASSIVPTSDMLHILRLITRSEPLDVILRRVADTIAARFPIKKFTICILDDTTGYLRPSIVHGFPEDQARAIKRHAYRLESKAVEMADESLIADDCHYVRTEQRKDIDDSDFDYIQDISRIREPRESKDEWGELDYINFSMKDRLGNLIGWVEIDEPTEGHMPSREEIADMQMLTALLSIAIEDSRMSEDAIDSLKESRRYLDIIVHDIGSVMDPLSSRLEAVRNRGFIAREDAADIALALELVGEAKSLVDNVRKISKVRSGEAAEARVYDLREILVKCISNAKEDHPTKDVVVGLDCPFEFCNVVADELIYDMFSGVLSNVVRRSLDETAEIDISIMNGHSAWKVRIEDCASDGSDHAQEPRNDRNRGQRESKRLSAGDHELMMTILELLVDRYNGLLTMAGGGYGAHEKPACFEIALPKAPEEQEREAGADFGANGTGFEAK